MGIALKSLDAMNLGTVGVNLGNVEAYRVALKGLSVEQSVFALASKGATEEQIRQILVTDQAKLKDVEAAMAKAGLTTATKALNAEEIIELATKKGISIERAKEIASALGLIATEEGQVISKKQLTVATLQQVGATDAEITAILGLNAAETANIGITNVLTASFAKLWAVITAHPIGAILTAIGVVAVGAVAAYNKWGDTLENTKEKLSDLKSECQEIVSDLQAVNSELETTQQRLEELEGKDTLTFTEKEEYDNLVKINNELQRKIDLLELEEKNKRKEQNKTFVSAMEKDTENPFEHEVNPDGKKPAGQYSISDEYLTSETGYINAQFEIREQLLDDLANAETEKEKERIQKRIDEINSYLEDKNTEWKTVSDGIDYIENPTTEDDKAVNEWLDYIADFQDRMAIAMSKDDASSNAQYKTNTFNRVVDNWQFDETVQGLQDLGKEGKVTAEMLDDPKYDEFINKLVFLGVIDSADNLEDVALAFNSVADSAENAADSASQYGNKITVSEQLAKIEDLSNGLDQLDSIYADILDKEDFDFSSLLNNDDFANAFSQYTDQYENFIDTITKSPTDINACQEAFNELATAYINGSEALNSLTEATRDSTINELQQMGVSNAEEVVDAYLRIANAKRDALAAGVDMENITLAEINSLYNEGIIALTTAQYLAYYQFQKALSNENGINTQADCENLIALATNAGITGDVINSLNELMALHQEISLAAQYQDKDTVAVLTARADELLASIKSQASTMESAYNPVVKYTGASKTAAAAQDKLKDSTDAVTEAMEKEKKALESTKSELEKQKQYYEDVAEAIDWFYDKQIEKQEKAIDSLEKENELLEERIDYYDGALSAIDRYYEKQIEKLEEQKDALNGNNKEVEASINLEKRQQELLEAKSRKTIGLYQKGKGIGYVTDNSAIKTAEENLAEAQRQKDEADIDAQIDKLKEYQSLWAEIPSVKEKAEQDSQMIQLLGAEWESILLEGRIQNITAFKDQYVGLQQQIDNNESMIASYEEKIAYYESLKTEWDNLLNKYTEDTYTQLLIGAFGNDFENELLNGRTGRWTQFAEDYYNIQVQLKEVTDQIESLAKRMEE